MKKNNINATPLNMMSISDNEFDEIRSLIYDRIGIHLQDQKRTLVVGRLQKYLKGLGYDNFSVYISYLKNDKTGQALVDLVNRISTNHTYFYRESEHFDFMVNRALPEMEKILEQQKSKDLRIWCAGCSSGEEPYMLVMLMKEYFGARYKSLDAGVLATDISKKALGIAEKGIYDKERVSRVPDVMRRKYFKKVDDTYLKVDDAVRKEVVFRQFNLMEEQSQFKKQFHIIFCRNVMIYFDLPTREALVARFYDMTTPGGYFFIGHSESVRGVAGYNYIMPAVYQRGF